MWVSVALIVALSAVSWVVLWPMLSPERHIAHKGVVFPQLSEVSQEPTYQPCYPDWRGYV